MHAHVQTCPGKTHFSTTDTHTHTHTHTHTEADTKAPTHAPNTHKSL